MAGNPEFKNARPDGFSIYTGEGFELPGHHCFLAKFVEWEPERFSTDLLSYYQFRNGDFLITELDEFELGALADPYRWKAGRASVLHRYKALEYTPSLVKRAHRLR